MLGLSRLTKPDLRTRVRRALHEPTTIDGWYHLLQCLVALDMIFFYAEGALQRADAGVPGFLARTYGLPASALAGWFLCNAGLILIKRLSQAWFYVAILPVIVYLFGAWALQGANVAVSPATLGGHVGFVVLMLFLIRFMLWLRKWMVGHASGTTSTKRH